MGRAAAPFTGVFRDPVRQTWAFPPLFGQRLIADRQRLLSAALEAQQLCLKDQKETFPLVPVLSFVFVFLSLGGKVAQALTPVLLLEEALGDPLHLTTTQAASCSPSNQH